MNLKERVKMAIVKEHTANNLFNSTTLENTINRIFKNNYEVNNLIIYSLLVRCQYKKYL